METTPTRETVIQVGRAVLGGVFVFVLPVVFRETGVIEVKLIYRVMQVCQVLQRTGETDIPAHTRLQQDPRWLESRIGNVG